jgi:glycosyltransferase involved in cell wall biosynthesis
VRVGFLTTWAVDDPAAWSGVVVPMHAALSERVDVVPVPVPAARHHVVDRAATRVLGSRGRGYLPGHGLATSHAGADGVSRAVRAARVDVVLSVAASTPLAFAEVGAPVVEVGDATFRLLLGYYPLFTGLHASARWQGEVLARRTARRSAGFILTSEWAAESLAFDYAVPRSRIRVAPFGPSTTSTRPPTGPRPGEPLRALFVGSDWARKGGDLAVEVVSELNSRGTPCVLTVVGDGPDLPHGVTRLGRVPRDRMGELYASHDVLLEPARANAGGVTLTDATASGLPVVATRTGGVPTIVEDGVTGHLVDPGRLVPEAVDALARLSVPEHWREMSGAARRRGREELSWVRWATTAVELCEEVRHGPPRQA